MTAAHPFELGGEKETVACPFPAVALTPVGAHGAVRVSVVIVCDTDNLGD